MEKPVRSLLVSEYFPNRPEQMVHGVFQRLRRHVEALTSIGPVDLVFLWPLHWTESEADRLAALEAFRRSWSIAGRTAFVAPPIVPFGSRRKAIDLVDLRAATHGALAFNDGWPHMRSSRGAEAARIEAIIADWQPDLVFAHRLAATAALIRARRPLPPVIADFDDLEHVAMRRSIGASSSRSKRLKLLVSAALARRTERQVVKWATVSLVCSEHDRAILKRLAPEARIELAPNTASARTTEPVAAAPTALFVGYARYQPNREAILWLVREVFPIVRARLPAARLVIAGDGGPELKVADAALGIEALGFVPDLAPLYAAARVAVCPIRRGGGTRIKIIEAAMNGRPIVSTTIGAEGLELVDGREIRLADDAESFAAAMIELMSDDAEAAALGAAAASAAGRLYGAAKIASDLARLAASIAKR